MSDLNFPQGDLRNKKREKTLETDDVILALDAKFKVGAVIGDMTTILDETNYVNKFENDNTPLSDDNTNKTYNNQKDTAFVITSVFSILFLILGTLYVSFAATRTNTNFIATVFTLFGSPDGTNFQTNVGSYNIWKISTVIAYLSFVLYGLIALTSKTSMEYKTTTVKKSQPETGYNVEVLLIGVDYIGWILIVFTGCFVIWSIAQVIGEVDIIELLSLIIINIIIGLVGGLMTEIVNSGITTHTSRSNIDNPVDDKLRINWLPFIFGGVIPFLLLISLLLISITYTQQSVKNGLYIQWFMVSLFAFFHIILLFTIFTRYTLAKRLYPKLEKEDDPDSIKGQTESRFIKINGIYRITKLVVNGLELLAIILLLFIQLFIV